MVEISPFHGMTYNKEKIHVLNDVMSPPYDIISETMQNELYTKHPYNFVRLILGKQFLEDTEENNRYTRAKTVFEEWQKQGILIPSSNKTIFPYKIEYQLKNQRKTMNGFFVLLKLDPEYKVVKAHEKTLSKPKADRLNLMRSCYANLEPIELLYMDKNDTIHKTMKDSLKEPLIRVKGYDGFTHSMWKLDNEQVISKIITLLEDKILFIADGHHRYQTSLNFVQEQQKKTGNTKQDAPYNYIMVVLANMFDPGLAILPTHRLLKLPDLNLDTLFKTLKQYFTIEEKNVSTKTKDYDSIGKHIMHDIETKTAHKFALYHQKKYYLFTLKNERIMNTIATDHSQTWRTLDVSILHKLILEQGLGISDTNIEDHIKYTRVDAEAIQLVDEGIYNASFLMNATKIDELKAVAEAGEHMPQKSTYFLPKMLSGLVMYKM
ncbi:MAG: DUF1015 domain-containing protein [Methanobacteriota archaeon]